jgi:hypothetical protein
MGRDMVFQTHVNNLRLNEQKIESYLSSLIPIPRLEFFLLSFLLLSVRLAHGH